MKQLTILLLLLLVSTLTYAQDIDEWYHTVYRFQCPECNNVQFATQYSRMHNDSDMIWSDGRIIIQGAIEVPYIQQCNNCNMYFTFRSGNREVTTDYTTAPTVTMSYQQVYNAMSQFFALKNYVSEDDLLSICLYYMQAYNDEYFREETGKAPSAEERALLLSCAKIFYNYMKENSATNDLAEIAIEFCREAGLWLEADELVSVIQKMASKRGQLYQSQVRQLVQRIKDRDSRVFLP